MVKVIKLIVCISLFTAFCVVGLYTPFIPGAPGSIQTIQEKLIADAQKSLFDAKQSNWAELEVVGQKAILSGEAPSKDAKDLAIDSLESATGGKGFLRSGINQVDATQVTLGPYRFKADYRTNFIRISDNLPSLAAQTQINSYLKAIFPDIQHFPQTQIVSGAPNEQWTQIVETALYAISPLEEGVVLIEDKEIKISGVAFSVYERNTAIERAREIPTNYTYTVDIRIDPTYKRSFDFNNQLLDDDIESDLSDIERSLDEGNLDGSSPNRTDLNGIGLDEIDPTITDDNQDILDASKAETLSNTPTLQTQPPVPSIQVPRAEDIVKPRVTRGTTTDNPNRLTDEADNINQNLQPIEESSKGLPPVPQPRERFRTAPTPPDGLERIQAQKDELSRLSSAPENISSVPRLQPGTSSLSSDDLSSNEGAPGLVTAGIVASGVVASTILTSNNDEVTLGDGINTPTASASSINVSGLNTSDGAPLNANQLASGSVAQIAQSLYIVNQTGVNDRTSELNRICQNELNILLAQRPIKFKGDSADIVNDSRPNIASLASSMVRCQNNFSFEITGHTNDLPDKTANRKLSKERADTIKALLSARGVANDKMTAYGRGSSSPFTQSADQPALENNNRIDIFLINTKNN